MGFLDIGNKKTSRTASARASSAALKRRRLRYFSQIDRLPPVFWLAFQRNTPSRGARHGLELFFTRHWTEFIGNMPPPTTTQAFFGYLSFFIRKVRVADSRKPFGLKNVFKSPPWIWSKTVFPRNKLKKIPNSCGEKINDYGRIIEFLPNLRDFPISRDVGLGVGRKPINCSCRCEFPQDQKFK